MSHAAGRRLGFGQRQKLIGDQGSGGNPRAFELYRVVDTPRRAGASIAEGVDDHVASVGQFLQTVRSGTAHFSFGNQLDTVATFFQKRPDKGEKLIGIGFVVIEETDLLSVEASVRSTGELGLFGNAGCRWIHNLYQFGFHRYLRYGKRNPSSFEPKLMLWHFV
jgi:hypothetical protein